MLLLLLERRNALVTLFQHCGPVTIGNTHTCLRSSFRLAISAAFSSLVMPAVLFVADTVGAGSALPLSEGVAERTPEPGLDAPTSGEAARGAVVGRVGCGAIGSFGEGAGAGADIAQVSMADTSST